MRIIGFAGKKQSGKTTSARFITGCVLLDLGLASSFKIDGDDIIVPIGEEHHVYDINSADDTNAGVVWPCVRTLNLADSLKSFAINVLGLDHNLVYGSDEDKNTLTTYQWENMPQIKGVKLPKDKTGFMTVRDCLQFWGSDIFRKIYPNVWVDSLLRAVQSIDTKLLMIADIRFPNEVEAIKRVGGAVIKLTRSPFKDEHHSETSLDPENFDQSKFDFILDNTEKTLEEKNNELIRIFKSLHIFDENSSVNYIS